MTSGLWPAPSAENGVWVVRLAPFKAPPMSMNEARRAHWSDVSRDKQQVALATLAAVRAARVPRLERAMARLVWYAPDYGTRDADGLALMLKAVMDALTPPRPAVPKGAPTVRGTPRKTAQAAKLGAGILADDHAGYVPETALRIELGSRDPRIELELRALPALPPRRRR